MLTQFRTFGLFTLLAAAPQLFAAVPGTLDPSFSLDGKLTTEAGAEFSTAEAVIQQVNGKLVAVGVNKNFQENEKIAVVRYNSDGTRDSDFGINGLVSTRVGNGNSSAFAAVQQIDGSLVVAGRSFNVTNEDFTLARYTSTGALDSSFNGTGMVVTPVDFDDDGAFAVIQDSKTTLTAAGTSRITGQNNFALLRYNLDGSLDTTFGGDGKVTTDFGNQGDDVAFALIRQSNGKLVAAGFSNNGSNDDFAVARYNIDGSLDTSFSGDGLARTDIGSGQDQALTILQQPDGKLVVAGFSTVDGNNEIAVVRYNTNGTLDKSFSNDGKLLTRLGTGDDRAFKVLQQFDGKLLVAGYTQKSSADSDFVIVRYNTDGTRDTGFRADGILTTNFGSAEDPGIDRAFSAVIQSNGNIVLAGTSNIGGVPKMALARYLFNDEDSDGVRNDKDNCPYTPNPDQADSDDDGDGDACDPDDDNDGVPDKKDACPFDPGESVDTDGDRICNNSDSDDDNDGVPDADDPSPLVGIIGDRSNDFLGYSVASAGDIDGDGFDDLIVGIPKSDPILPGKTKRATDAGSVIVYSGKTALPIPTLAFTGDSPGDEFGIAVAGAGDVNKDNVPDILVGAHKADVRDPGTQKIVKKNAGRAVVFSGATGARLFDFYGDAAGDGLGIAVDIVGDTDADGFDDVAAGASKADKIDAGTGKKVSDAGAVHLYSGQTHNRLHKFEGESKGDFFGCAVSSADVNNDSRPDIVAGAYGRDAALTGKKLKNAGSVYLFSATDYALIRRLDGAHAGDQLGFSVAGIADVNNDAYADILLGAPKEDAPNPASHKHVKDSGTVHIVSGRDGSSLDPADPDNPVNNSPQAGALFGSSVRAAGDFNNDSIPDFVVGSYQYDAVINDKKLPGTGRVSVHSGNSGKQIFFLDGHEINSFYSFAVSGGGDQNNDGFSDILVGAHKTDSKNPETLKPVGNSGVVEVISGRSVAGP